MQIRHPHWALTNLSGSAISKFATAVIPANWISGCQVEPVTLRTRSHSSGFPSPSLPLILVYLQVFLKAVKRSYR